MTLFEYRRENSIIHRAPPVLKLILMCVISVLVFEMNNKAVWIWVSAFAVLVFIFFILAKTPFNHLKKLSFVPVLGILLTAFRMIRIPFEIDFMQMTAGFLYTFRFFVTSLSALVLFETTSRLQLLTAIEQIEKSIKFILPPLRSFNFSKTVAIAISFIPEVFAVWRKVNYAASSRSPHSFSTIKKGEKSYVVIRCKTQLSFSRKIGVFIAELSALLSCMLQRTEETRRAIENRSQF